MKAIQSAAMIIMLLVAAFICAAEKDTDRDGIPDSKDRRPIVAEYYRNTAPTPVDPKSQPSNLDTDGDGIVDQQDTRPWVASYYKHSGIPPYDLKTQPNDVDTDYDGVPDNLENRPSVAEYYHTRGDQLHALTKPTGTRETDTDHDGVPDKIDNCANTPAGTKVDASGCPLDSDHDGVTDAQDKCPNTPAGARVDASGCVTDSDKDGVPDYLDKCQNTPKGIPVDSTGCPKLVKKGEKITLEIEYATNSFEPDSKSKEVLDGIAQTMKDFPEINIAVKGYTDNVGSDSHNQKLSELRAKRIMEYLAGRGVENRRMSSKGYGENPKYFVGDNATEAGRQKNRRVEIESVN